MLPFVGSIKTPAVQDIVLEVGRHLDGDGPSGFLEGTATAGSTALNLEDTVNLLSSIAQDDMYTDRWIWRPQAAQLADRQRVVKLYIPNLGVVQADSVYNVGPTGEPYALFSMMAPAAIQDCLNRALRRLCFEDEVTLAPSTTDMLQRRYDLTALYPWLTDPWMVREVGFLTTNLQRQDYDPYAVVIKGQCYRSDETMYVELPAGYGNSGTFYIKVVRPYATRVNGVDSTTGIALPSDTVDVQFDWIVWATLTHCYQRLLRNASQEERQMLIADAGTAAANMTMYTRRYFRMPKNTFMDSPYLSGSPLGSDESGLLYRAG